MWHVGRCAARRFGSDSRHGLFTVLKTAILIVSYRRDLEFFAACAKSISKFARGFDYAKVVVPTGDAELFKPLAEPNGIAVVGFEEEPGKGFLSHLRMKCYADHHFPDADVIFHFDSDCVFAFESRPTDWIPDGKILLCFQDFSNFLKKPVAPDEIKNFMGFSGLKVDFDRGCYFWKWATDWCMGFDVVRETMQTMPIAHWRHVYPHMRKHIEGRFGKSFDEFIFSCRNEFPQTFCEFNSLGAIAHRFYPDQYHWRDIASQGYPPVRAVQCWSRGGLDLPYTYGKEVGGHQTPRQLFQRLGIA